MGYKNLKVSIIGIGRVGLPLALFLESLGCKVVGIDKDSEVLRDVRKKKMSFDEPGCAALLKKTKMTISPSIQSGVRGSDYIIITVGTPLYNHIESDLSYIKSVCTDLCGSLKEGQTIILRSTVAPGTTSYLKNFVEDNTSLKIGKNFGLAFCPERLAENQAIEELGLLPQIIGTEDNFSKKTTNKLFNLFGVELLFTNYLSAELIKLFNNVHRFTDFAVANQFSVIAEKYNQNIYEIINMANKNYPRGHIPSPGLTAGTCLRKDFGLLNESSPAPDLFLSAWKINEHMPFHLVNSAKKYTKIRGKTIAVLGYGFKKNSDDIRDSLVPKLLRYIEREVPKKVLLCEPNIPKKNIEGFKNTDLNSCLKKADIIFIAINHDAFNKETILGKIKKNAWCVDLWNVLGQKQLVLRYN